MRFTDVTFWVLACELQRIGHRNSCKITHSGADNFGTKITRHFFFGAVDVSLHRFLEIFAGNLDTTSGERAGTQREET